MTSVLRLFWQILLLRASPGELPYSQTLLVLMLFAHFGVEVALASFTLPMDTAILSAAVGILALYSLPWLLLSFYSLTARTTQVVTALAGCEVAIELLSLPASAWFYAVPKIDAGTPALLLLLLLGWNVVVAAHIFRHAVGVSKGFGFLFAMLYMLVSIFMVSLLGAPEG